MKLFVDWEIVSAFVGDAGVTALRVRQHEFASLLFPGIVARKKGRSAVLRAITNMRPDIVALLNPM